MPAPGEKRDRRADLASAIIGASYGTCYRRAHLAGFSRSVLGGPGSDGTANPARFSYSAMSTVRPHAGDLSRWSVRCSADADLGPMARRSVARTSVSPARSVRPLPLLPPAVHLT